MTSSQKQPVRTQRKRLKYELKDCAPGPEVREHKYTAESIGTVVRLLFSSTWSLRGESQNVGRNRPTADTSSQDVKCSVSSTVH